MNCLQSIIDTIKTKGDITFTEFMHLALYTPNLGYYMSNSVQIGREGDFVTSPELSPLFGYTLANQLKDVLEGLKSPAIMEFGAGSGKLCIDILTQLEKLDALPDYYMILEVSAHLRKQQQNHIKNAIPHLYHKVVFLDSLPKDAFEGVILANEVIDAMPVSRFQQNEDSILKSHIGLGENGELIETFKSFSDDLLLNKINKLEIETFPYQSEINPYLDDWIKSCYQCLSKGIVLLIDYGFPQHEYYHPDRNTGTIMCHYQQQSHPNPLIHIGMQDITAHVDFTHIASAAYEAGFHVAGYTNQASFLLANGLLSLVDENEKNRLSQIQAIKMLTQHQEMGELFKVIALTKALDIDLIGFQLSDKRASL
jgi:SAM-dependent MidA family methyltransferase